MPQSDQQLVQQTLSGNVNAFNQLVTKYQGAVYGVAFHWTKNFADAEDITQEAFFLAYEKLEQLQDPQKFAGWLNRITTNMCYKWRRRQPDQTISIDASKSQEFSDQLQHSGKHPDEALETKEIQLAIQNTFKTLSDKVRLTATLFYLDDLSYQEISDFLEIPISTIKSRLYKARKKLKREAIEMLEETLGQHKNSPKIEIKKVSGYVHILKEGHGHLRSTLDASHNKNDIFVSERYISLFALKPGDFVESHGRALKNEQGDIYYAAMRFEQINQTPAVSQAPELKDPKEAMYSENLKRVFASARKIAEDWKNGYVGTEHLLMGILQTEDAKTQQLWNNLCVNVGAFGQRLKDWIGHHSNDKLETEIRFTPRAKAIIQSAAQEAGALNIHLTDIEHLLLALTRDKNSAAALVLWDFNVKYEYLKKEIISNSNYS